MNVVKEIQRITQRELDMGIAGGTTKGSWHDKYKDSAWVYIGGLSYELSEGDIICFMSQWGEIEDINLVREKATNKSMGFAFIKYEDQRSTILAVDNFNGIQLLGRTLRCDHVDKYKLPKNVREKEEEALEENPDLDVKIGPGHAYTDKDLANSFNISQGQDLWAVNSSSKSKKKHRKSNDLGSEEDDDDSQNNHKKKKKEKKTKKHKHDRHQMESEFEKKSDSYRDSRETQEQKISENIASSVGSEPSRKAFPNDAVLAAPGAVSSWRGRKDPVVAVIFEQDKRRTENMEKKGELVKRGEFAGFGGMRRRR